MNLDFTTLTYYAERKDMIKMYYMSSINCDKFDLKCIAER